MKSVRAKMMIFLGSATALLLIVLGILLYLQINNTVVPLTKELNMGLAIARSSEVERLIEGYLKSVKAITDDSSFISGNMDLISSEIEK